MKKEPANSSAVDAIFIFDSLEASAQWAKLNVDLNFLCVVQLFGKSLN